MSTEQLQQLRATFLSPLLCRRYRAAIPPGEGIGQTRRKAGESRKGHLFSSREIVPLPPPAGTFVFFVTGILGQGSSLMKKNWITYSPTRQLGPMAFWVHLSADGRPWHQSEVFDPPLPASVPGKGFPLFHVEIDIAALHFSSLTELRVCIETLSQKALPTSKVLSEKHGANYGPSNHWLNRLPLRSMAWPHRQKAIKYLQTALLNFERQIPDWKERPDRITQT